MLLGKLQRIPNAYSDELWELIHAMLDRNPSRRPSMEQIFARPAVRARRHLWAGAGADPGGAIAGEGEGEALRFRFLEEGEASHGRGFMEGRREGREREGVQLCA